MSSYVSGPTDDTSPILTHSELDNLFADLETRFPTADDGLDEILSPVLRLLLLNNVLFRPEGLAGGDSDWRSVVTGLGVIMGGNRKSFARCLTRMEEWCPDDAGPRDIETRSLMGPLLRLGVFEREWPQIAKTYFENAQKRTRADVDGSNTSLRTTLNSLQVGMYLDCSTMRRPLSM